MSSIAQELCDQICEDPPLKQSKHSTRESYKKLNHASSSRYDRSPMTTVTVEKQRVINKLVPSGHSRSKIVINKFKSKETLLQKTFVDKALNTTITGPLRCDNDCVTMVRKRDFNKGICKCGNKRSNCRVSVKEIQTFASKPYSQLDKACAQCIETVNCSTQFLEKLSSRRVLPPVRSRSKLCNDVDTQTVEVKEAKENQKGKNDDSSTKSKIGYNYKGARRWALSQYPTRGPDF